MNIHRAPADSVLGRIADRTFADLMVRRARVSEAELEGSIASAPRDFRAALTAPTTQGLALIAEFKPRSPSRGEIRPGAQPETIAAAYEPYAAAISVLCDRPFFGGGHELLARVRASSTRPVLCKDFILDRYQVIEALAFGADAVLLMVSLLEPDTLATLLALTRDLGMAALVETHDADEVAVAVDVGADIIGVNSRDLRTLDIDLGLIPTLCDAVPAGLIKVAESGLLSAADVDFVRPHVDATLIGSAIMAAPDPAAQIEALGFPSCR